MCIHSEENSTKDIESTKNLLVKKLSKITLTIDSENIEEDLLQNFSNILSSTIQDFISKKTYIGKTKQEKPVLIFKGKVKTDTPNCPHCGGNVHKDGFYTISILHLPFASMMVKLEIDKERFYCPHCKLLVIQKFSLKTPEHRISLMLEQSIKDMLEKNIFTMKEISLITGVCRNIVKKIDNRRLSEEKNQTLMQAESSPRFISIIEFFLKDVQKYVTTILSLETGHVLWIAYGKKEQVLYDFLDQVGENWLNCIECLVSDTNFEFK